VVTTFNGTAILASAGTLSFQIGANVTTNDALSVASTTLTAATTIVAVTAATAVIDSAARTAAVGSMITALDSAIDSINGQRAICGATRNRFDAVISNLQSSVVNQSAAKSRITDADFAEETANLSRAQILRQAGTAMVAQANQLPQGVLKLLQ
jgi:flagellin